MYCYTLTKNTEIESGIAMFWQGDWHISSDAMLRTCRHDPPQMYEGNNSGVYDTVMAASVVRLRVNDTVYHVLRKPNDADNRVMIQDNYSKTLCGPKEIEAIRGGFTRISHEIFYTSRGSVLRVGLRYLVVKENGIMFVCNKPGMEYYMTSLATADEVTVL